MTDTFGIDKILTEIFSNSDIIITSYLCEIIEEALTNEQIFDYSELTSILTEPLNNYQLYSSHDELNSLVILIFDKLVEYNYITAPEKLRSNVLKSVRIGIKVKALYYQDKNWYNAQITDIDMINGCNIVSVIFTEYGNTEWIDPLYIKIEKQQIKNHKPNFKISDKINEMNKINEFINYQIYHDHEKPQNDLIEIKQVADKQKQIIINNVCFVPNSNKQLDEKELKADTETYLNNFDKECDDMLQENGHYYCYKDRCNGYLYIEQKNVAKIKEFNCPECGFINCVACGTVHQKEKLTKGVSMLLSCSNFQFLHNNMFLKYWRIGCGKKLKMKERVKYLPKSNVFPTSFGVRKHSIEWNFVIDCVLHKDNIEICEMERIQNVNLWNKYYNKCIKLICEGKDVQQKCVWHGTRKTKPSVIWGNLGFDIAHARVGGCIWFAVDNRYSMGGFKYSLENGKYQVILSFVATGSSDVVFIRNDLILNVYRNDVTYPAYVVSFRCK